MKQFFKFGLGLGLCLTSLNPAALARGGGTVGSDTLGQSQRALVLAEQCLSQEIDLVKRASYIEYRRKFFKDPSMFLMTALAEEFIKDRLNFVLNEYNSISKYLDDLDEKLLLAERKASNKSQKDKIRQTRRNNAKLEQEFLANYEKATERHADLDMQVTSLAPLLNFIMQNKEVIEENTKELRWHRSDASLLAPLIRGDKFVDVLANSKSCADFKASFMALDNDLQLIQIESVYDEQDGSNKNSLLGMPFPELMTAMVYEDLSLAIEQNDQEFLLEANEGMRIALEFQGYINASKTYSINRDSILAYEAAWASDMLGAGSINKKLNAQELEKTLEKMAYQNNIKKMNALAKSLSKLIGVKSSR